MFWQYWSYLQGLPYGFTGRHIKIIQKIQIKNRKIHQKDEEISYQYLSKLALKTKDSFLSTYQLIQGRNGSDSESKAEMDGITMDLKLYSKKEQSVGKLLESEYNNQTKNLSEQSNIQNVKVYDVVKGSGCYIQQIDYEIKK